jgi:hypothetical protein
MTHRQNMTRSPPQKTFASGICFGEKPCALFKLFVSRFPILSKGILAMKHLAIISMAACLAFAANTARADLINVDFGSYGTAMSGAAMVGSAGDTWNKISSSVTSSPLVNSAGVTVSGVTMTVSNASGYTCCYYGSANHSPFAMDNSLYNLMSDYLYVKGNNTATITLSGLAAGTYELYVYSEADTGIDARSRETQYTVATSSTTTSVVVGPSNNATTLTQGANYEILEIVVGSDKTVTISVASAIANGEADVCGFQLQSVPEPASASLTVSAVIGLLAYAWRKRKKV